MTSPVGAPYDPTGQPFPDLDGSNGDGPLLVQLTGEVLSHDITFKSSSLDRGLLAKLIDAAWWLKTNMATAASLSAYVALIAKKTAASGDTLVGVQSITSATTSGLGVSGAGTLRAVLQFIFDNTITDLDSTAVGAGVSAVTIDATVNRTYHVDTPTQAVMTVTLKSTSPIPRQGAEIQFTAYSIANTKSVIVARENATQITIMTGTASGQNFGSGRYKFISGSWRLMSATGLGATASANDGAINNP